MSSGYLMLLVADFHIPTVEKRYLICELAKINKSNNERGASCCDDAV